MLFLEVVLAFFETVPFVYSRHSQRQFQYSSTSKSHLSESSRQCVERICLKYRTVRYNVWTMAFRTGTRRPRDPMMVFKRGWRRSENLQPIYLGPVHLNQYFNVGGASFWYAFAVRLFDTTDGTSCLAIPPIENDTKCISRCLGWLVDHSHNHILNTYINGRHMQGLDFEFEANTKRIAILVEYSLIEHRMSNDVCLKRGLRMICRENVVRLEMFQGTFY